MANRQQDYGSGQRSGQDREHDEDRRYGDYTQNDEGDSSVRSGSYDEGRTRQGGRDSSEQGRSGGGSGGQYSGYGNFGQGDYDRSGRGANTGQNRYGQGRDQGYGQGNYSQPNYGYGEVR